MINCGLGAARAVKLAGAARDRDICVPPGGKMERDDRRFVRNKNFIFRQIVEEMVLVPIRQNVADLDSIYTLNELGVFIWERLETPISAAELQDDILEDFDVDAATVQSDLTIFIEELERIGAVEAINA